MISGFCSGFNQFHTCEPVGPDFNISMYGSSCIYLILKHILASLFSRSFYWHPQGKKGCQGRDRESKTERI